MEKNIRYLKLLVRISKSIKASDSPDKRILYNKVHDKLMYYDIKLATISDHYNRARRIIKFVGEIRGVPEDYFTIKTRKRIIVTSRFISMTLIKNNTKLSLSDTGYLFGKDHATVLHAIKTVNNLMDTDKFFRQGYDFIVRTLKLEHKPYKDSKHSINFS